MSGGGSSRRRSGGPASGNKRPYLREIDYRRPCRLPMSHMSYVGRPVFTTSHVGSIAWLWTIMMREFGRDALELSGGACLDEKETRGDQNGKEGPLSYIHLPLTPIYYSGGISGSAARSTSTEYDLLASRLRVILNTGLECHLPASYDR